MGIRRFIIMFVMVLIATSAFSQELSHMVMVPAAGIITSGSVDLSQTIGETAVEIFSLQDFSITQGFQQPSVVLTTGTQPEGTGAKVYPSPVSEDLTIELYGETARSFVITIVNIYGSAVRNIELNFTGPYWYKHVEPIGDLASGLYLVNIVSRDKVVRRTMKIEKM
jgi:hypothetical protein